MQGQPAALARELHGLAEERSVPLSMILELTYRCNERCLHCYLPGTRLGPESELNTAEWFGALEALAEAGTLYLILTGGEVLLRPDLSEILRRGRELRFSIEIFTNASLLTPETADSWLEAAVAGVGVSCYSPKPAEHDRITRTPGSFERTLRGARLLAERGIPVKLKCPLMSSNLKDAGALIALAGELGARWQFDPVIVPGNDGSKAPLELGLRDAQLLKVYETPELMEGGELASARPLAGGEPTCAAGRSLGAINPYGDVLACIQWLAPAGNVRTKRFQDIWLGGPALLKARRITAKDVKPCPDCGEAHFMHCLGLSQLERNDPLIPSSDCCRISRAIREIQRTAASRNLVEAVP
ncbi:MAG: radical SAM protein [Elusimicrobia bacterium]|nr:radical SAM protein [Elusimicrobiota bacterium]